MYSFVHFSISKQYTTHSNNHGSRIYILFLKMCVTGTEYRIWPYKFTQFETDSCPFITLALINTQPYKVQRLSIMWRTRRVESNTSVNKNPAPLKSEFNVSFQGFGHAAMRKFLIFDFSLRKRLLTGTVPVNNFLLTGTVPVLGTWYYMLHGTGYLIHDS